MQGPFPTMHAEPAEPHEPPSEEPEFDWAALVTLAIHPTKVAIIEALLWIGRPLSAKELLASFGNNEHGLSEVSYHLRTLAEHHVLEQADVKQVRGALQRFYFFPRRRRRGPASR